AMLNRREGPPLPPGAGRRGLLAASGSLAVVGGAETQEIAAQEHAACGSPVHMVHLGGQRTYALCQTVSTPGLGLALGQGRGPPWARHDFSLVLDSARAGRGVVQVAAMQAG